MNKFKGIYFNKEGKKSGIEFSLQDGVIELSTSGELNTLARLQLSDLKVSLGGSRNNIIFFKGSGHSFYSELNKALCHDLKLVEQTHVSLVLNEYTRKQSQKSALYLIILLLFLLSGFGLFQGRSYIVESIVKAIPFEVEKQVGDQLFSLQKAQFKFIENPNIVTALEKEVKVLRNVLPKDFQNFSLYIVKNSDVNAFAFPGGHVVVYEGLLENADSFSEVLGVMAHEISHVKNRHVIQGLIHNISLFSLVNILIGDISGIIAVVLENGGSLLSLKFSKEMEMKADNDGFNMLDLAGVNPAGFYSFLKKVQKIEKEKLEQLPFDSDLSKKIGDFFSTHPETELRLENILHRLKSLNLST